MKAKYSLFALAVIVASGLAACDRDNSKTLKVQAEASNTPETQSATYERIEKSNLQEAEFLRGEKINLSGMDTLNALIPFTNMVAVEKRAAVVKSLKAVIANSELQLGLAKAMKDEFKISKAERMISSAKTALSYVQNEIDADASKAKLGEGSKADFIAP